jgi:ribosomal protein S18 acetylase RimI-like enzyme
MDSATALALFDTQLRRHDGEQVGPVLRNSTRAGHWIEHSALTAENADDVIAGEVRHFAALGGRLEWKHYGYDTPADLPERLVAAGFVAEPPETLLVADVAEILAGPIAEARLPDGVTLEPVDDEAGFAGILELQSAVWGGEWRSLGTTLSAERAADPAALSLFRVVAGDQTVSAAWIRFHQGTDFASLWGGSTLPEWRQRGIYRALVAHRARLAAERGFRYLQVDCTEDSRPILERTGFVPLTITTPYIWTPPAS